VVTIGVERETISVTEGEVVEVCVQLLSGSIAEGREVMVTLASADGSAMGVFSLDVYRHCMLWPRDNVH